MRQVTFTPSLSLLALAGSADAAKHAAFADMQRGALVFLTSGTKNVLEDTRTALQEVSGARAKRVLSMVESVYAACNVHFSQHKRTPAADAAPIGERICASAIAAFDAAEDAAAAARTAKAAESKAAKIAAEKAMKKAAKSVAPLARALSIAEAIDALRVACAAADEQALSGLESLAGEFLTEVAAA